VMTDVETAKATLFMLLSDLGALLNTPMDQGVQVQVRSDASLREAAERLAAQGYYLVTVAANDERELEDRRYKIYYVLSHPSVDLFVIVEYLLDRGSDSYYSVSDRFPAVEPFEREMRDMVGLAPAATVGSSAPQRTVARGSWLHDAFPPDLFPLRRTETAVGLCQRAADVPDTAPARPADHEGPSAPQRESPGMTFPVGPIHAGIIESGQFLFTTAGEVIEDLRLRLGFTHRGVERMFQSQVSLVDGWCLAEQVSGDTSFAHSLAYCRAAEVLTDTRVTPAAKILRALFLELERIHNHVADVGGLAEDVGMDQFAAEFSVIREEMLRLNKRLTGHRYLRAVNRVGGVQLAEPLNPLDVACVLEKRIQDFEGLAKSLIARSGFRQRTIQVGILSPDEALKLGVTGLVARASGIARDSRLEHPVGADRDAGHILRDTPRALGDDQEATAGDVFARALVRAREVLVSRRLIEWLLQQWAQQPEADRRALAAVPRILPENNYVSAIGYAEGCRGDVVYWLMQDKLKGIYRCKVRDPSMLNWPALRECVLPKAVGGVRRETLIADFPLLNKSFSLSYAGNDL
jgi:Ni,Fe-hydrogenase III large subunit/Ni,Fe-hydrogenase III component G